MKNYSVALFCLIPFLLPMSLLAQDLPNVIPPSPEAASLIRYSQTEVSTYTGLPEIQIPIHTISFKGVNVPISLTYNSGGIKVEDIASWVGLGWNLNAGGLVTRTINWLPDNSPNGYMNTTNNTLADFAALPLGGPWCCSPGTKDYQLLNSRAEQSDYEPDEFNYSIPGYSGKFYYDQNLNDFVQIPYTNLKIELVNNGNRINGFEITTPEGIKYVFGGSSAYIEKIMGVKGMSLTYDGVFNSPADFYGDGTTPYNQSWMLHYIEFTSTLERITFNYDVQQETIKTTIRQEEEFTIPFNSNTAAYSINYLEKRFTQPRIKDIVFPSGRIEFIKSTNERVDLSNDYALDKIILYDDSNNYIKGVKLHQTQSVCLNESNYQAPFFDLSNIEGQHRLKLNAVSYIDVYDNELTRYSLEYNPLKLPQRFSRAIDYFGYFNGRLNDDLIPRAPYISQLPGVLFGNANRSINPEYTQAETLTKIIYPTGGYEEFIWENNRVSFFLEGDYLYRDYLLEIPDFLSNIQQFSDISDPNIDYARTFTVDPNSDGWFDFKIRMSGCQGPDLNDTNCDYIINLIGVTTPLNEGVLQDSFRKQLIPGETYKVTAKSRTNSSCDPTTDPSCAGDLLDVVFMHYVDPTPGEYLFGGLRVAQIKTYNYVQSNLPELTKNFDYTYFDTHPTPELSSGMAYRLPINSRSYHVFAANIGSTVKVSSNAPLVLNNGGYLGYKYVTESLQHENENNGYKKYIYSDLDLGADYLFEDSYYSSPFPSILKKSLKPAWRNGKLEELTYFNKDNVKVKKQTYKYESNNTLHRPGTDFAIQVIRGSRGDNDLVATYYGYTNEYYRLKKQINTDYFDSGNISTATEYIYNNNPLLASNIKFIDNSNKTHETIVTYPQDIPTPRSAEVQKLVDQNRFTSIQTENAIMDSNNLLSKSIQRKVFKDWGNSLVALEYIQTSKGDNILTDRIEFKEYDDYGNILQVSKADGMDITYIYGYNNSLPVAKIENATYAEVESQVENIQSMSDSDDDHCQDSGSCDEKNLRTALNALRSSLQNAMVTTYTYNPLIGISSMTDPKGYTIYYEYDEFNRLVRVKDEDGKIMSENKYHYLLEN